MTTAAPQSWPVADPTVWDVLYIAGVIAPGIAHVSIKGGTKIDRKAAKGQHSETLTFQGAKAKDVQITITVWDPDTFDQIPALMTALEPNIGKKNPEPLNIIHPMCQLRGVDAVAIEEVDGPEWDAAKQWFVIKIKAIEFRLPPPKNATSTATGTSGSKWTDDPKTAVEKATQDLAKAKTPEELQAAAEEANAALAGQAKRYAPPGASGDGANP